jgi:tRNA A-37 threonylcarbamoyl transferase component Bud32
VRETARFCGACGALVGPGAGRSAAIGDTIPVATGDTLVDRDSPASAGRPAGAALETGARLGAGGRYRVERLLGAGGFGEAYLATDTQLGRTCVVKRLAISPSWSPDERQLARQSFAREARLLVDLNTPGHPNIPEIYEYLAESDCLVMKHIVGQDLGQLLRQRGGRLPEPVALRYAREACSALAYMHGRAPEPAIHRDIKPANILVDAADRVWLIDFGLAKALPAPVARAGADRSQTAGTIGFTPPEQWRGRAEPRSDIYALGVTLHQLLTGYFAPTSDLLALIQGQGSLPPARELNPDVRPDVERLIERALAYDAAARPSAAEFLAELDRILARPAIPRPPEPARPPLAPAFVGRASELAAAADQLSRTHALAIVGLAGVGKSALAARLAAQVMDPEKVFWHTFHRDEGADALIWDLAGFLAWGGQAELWQLLQSARLTGGQPPPPEALCDYALRLLRGQGFLLCLDDFQLAEGDPLLDTLARRLAAEARAGQLELLISSRAAPAFARAGELLQLAGLNVGDTQALLSQRGVALPADLADTLVRYTAGSAQFLMLAADALQHAERPADAVAHLAEAGDIDRYLLREVDAYLERDERALMQAVAVLLGYPAGRDAIEALVDVGGARRMLAELSARGLLVAAESEEGRAYTACEIVRQFYYDSLARRERLDLHRRAADYFSDAPGEQLAAARHYALAGDLPQAAARATADVWSIVNQGQARALRALLGQLGPGQLAPELWADVLIARGEVGALLGEAEAARASFGAALERLEPLGDSAPVRERRARACRGMAESLEGAAPRQALDWLLRGLAQAVGSSSREEAALQIKLGTVQVALGAYAEAQAALDRGQALLPPGPSQLRINAFNTLGLLAYAQGQFDAGRRYTEQGLELCEQLGDDVRMAKMLINLGAHAAVGGDWPGALAAYGRAIELADRTGADRQRMFVDLNLGFLQVRTGDYSAALASLSSGIDLARAVESRVLEVAGLATLADLHIRQADLGAAAEALDRAQALADTIDARSQQPELLRCRAELELARGAAEMAREYAERSIALAGELQTDLEAGPSLRVLALALLHLGQRQPALDAFARSLALLDGKDPYEAARTRLAWGAALLEGGDHAPGAELISQARAEFARLGARADQAAAESLLT